MLVMTYCCLAFSYAERDIKLNEGLQFIKTAQQHMNTLDQATLKAFHFPSSCLDCKGWLLTKQGKTAEAIKCLEQALALSTGAETYWHLAAAYARKLQDCGKDDPQVPSLSMQVKVYCQHVQELDLNKEFEKRTQNLLQSLKEKEQQGN
jgi:tetratricopeptide (TPR) repeat protein